MPAWLIPILGLLGGEAVHRGGRALLMKMLGQGGQKAVQGAVGSAAARTAAAIPSATARRFLTPERLSGAALTTGGVLGGAAAFGAGNELVSGLFGSGDPYEPFGAGSLPAAAAPEGTGVDIDALVAELAGLGASDEDDLENPAMETMLRDSIQDVLGSRKLI